MSEEKRMLTGVYINPVKRICEVREIEDSLPSFYSLLDCDLIDITNRVVNGVEVSIICDDEGLLKEDRYPSAFNKDDEPVLVGSLFVVSPEADDEGNLMSLKEEDIPTIKASVCYYYDEDANLCLGLTDLDY